MDDNDKPCESDYWDELKRQRDEAQKELRKALSSLRSIVDITEEERPPAPECYVREIAIQAIARHALKEAE